MTRVNSRQMLLLILSTSCIGKVTARLLLNGEENYWSSGYALYFKIAENVLQNGHLYLGNPQHPEFCLYASRPPMYPLLIAAVCQLTNYSAPAFIIVEAFISTLTVALVFTTTRAIASERAGLYAAAAAAFFPYSFFHDTQLQETGLYACLSMASVFTLVIALRSGRGPMFFLTGLLLGAATLTRLSHVVPSLALVVFIPGKLPRKSAIQASALASLGLAICLMPWCLRNWVVTGNWALNSSQGSALAYAHNPHTFTISLIAGA
jgi:4-amino-4-deoxy-L-arabinose transferase-like glycosyltransferase